MRLTEILKSDLAGELLAKHDRWRLFRLPFEGNMFLNMAFYYGFQWTIYSLTSAELTEADNPVGSIRLTSNQIQPRIRNLHAKMMKNKPIVEAVPVGYSDRAVTSAQISMKLLDQWRNDLQEDEKDALTVDWLLICGNVGRKVGFDPNDGDQVGLKKEEFKDIIYGEDGEPRTQSFNFGSGESEDVGMPIGEIFDEVVPPFEIMYPEYASSFESAREFMQVKLFPLQEVKDKWGARAKNIIPSKNVSISSMFQRRLIGMSNPDVGTSFGINDPLLREEDLTYVFEHWMKPTKKYPKGRLVIAAGDGPNAILYAEDNPYYEALTEAKIPGAWPLIWFRCINAPGRVWDISPVEGMRPLQVEYNREITDIVQNRATVGRNKIIAPKTAGIDADEVSNMHGQILTYNGIMGPQIFPAQPLPQQVEREIERNRLDLDTISGSHEVSRAQVPSGVKSGIAINYLLEQDETTLAPIIHAWERAKCQLARAKLAIAKEFYTEDRIIKTANSNDANEIVQFKGTDLCTNIRLVQGSALPKSRAALQATYMDLWDRKAIVDEGGMPDPHKLFDLMKRSMGIDAFSEDENLDLIRARRENLMMSQGQPTMPKHWESHVVHIKEHNRFRKMEDFYNFPEQQQRLFDMHISAHIQYLAPPTPTPGAQEAMAATMPGGGGGGNGAPRRSPSMAGQGVMGALNNPPGNMGGTIPGGE